MECCGRHKLVKDGAPVKVGDVVHDHNGTCGVVVGWSCKHNRVHLRMLGSEVVFEYFPAIIGAEFMEV